MRTTVRIDDDLMRKLQNQAEREKTSVTQTLNAVLRRGLQAQVAKRTPYREKTFDLGVPLVNLDKALSLAAELEDGRIIQQMSASL